MNQTVLTIFASILSPTVLVAAVYKIFNLGKLYKLFEDSLQDISSLKKDVGVLKSDMTSVRTFLVTKTGMQDSLFRATSPLSLQPNGLKLLDASKFKEILQENKSVIMEKIKKYKHSTPAEIDEASVLTLNELIDSPLLENFKDVAFENGISVDILLKVCAIYLREEAIKEILPNY